jgi:hypothetical protein
VVKAKVVGRNTTSLASVVLERLLKVGGKLESMIQIVVMVRLVSKMGSRWVLKLEGVEIRRGTRR